MTEWARIAEYVQRPSDTNYLPIRNIADRIECLDDGVVCDFDDVDTCQAGLGVVRHPIPDHSIYRLQEGLVYVIRFGGETTGGLPTIIYDSVDGHGLAIYESEIFVAPDEKALVVIGVPGLLSDRPPIIFIYGSGLRRRYSIGMVSPGDSQRQESLQPITMDDQTIRVSNQQIIMVDGIPCRR